MPQIYDQLRYSPNICTYILLKTPYFDPKKFTRASFLSALAKSVGIRSVSIRSVWAKKNPEPLPVQGCLSIKEALSKERVEIGSYL